MAKVMIDDLRKSTVEDLKKSNENKRAELFALKFQAAVGSLEQTHRIKEIKREIARIELVLSEKAKAGEDVNKTVKANYASAVNEAEKAGKEVRAKQRKMIEEMQAQQFGVDANEIQAAMNAAEQEQEQEEPKGENE